ncbi:MAG: radical SAM protein [Treponema sp.]|jgi:MoaA/NifB/PqqE/SkfB family radical SAM enzyme|nr:radical SAM protein [Treponema sp.]
MYDFTKAIIKIENTTLCGASCVMCPRDEFKFHHQVMTLECFKKLSDETYRFGVRNMIFGGFGDPLMDVYLYERLDYVKQHYPDFQTSMIDTGHLLEGKKMRIVSTYIDVIKISNYGFSKEVYESVHRGSLKYEKIKSNIDEFLSLKKRSFTIMTFLDLPENHHEMAAWKAYYEPKCERIDIWKPHNWGGHTGGGGKGNYHPVQEGFIVIRFNFLRRWFGFPVLF